WSLFAAVLLTILLPVLFAAITSSHWGSMSAHERADRHPLDIALAGVNLSQLAIAVLGVLVITGEYSTGMIRASFTAVPKRLPVLWAKTAVFASVAFLLMLPPVLISFFASQAILSRHHILQISFSHPGVARSVLGGAVYLMLVGVIGLARGPPLVITEEAPADRSGRFHSRCSVARRAAMPVAATRGLPISLCWNSGGTPVRTAASRRRLRQSADSRLVAEWWSTEDEFGGGAGVSAWLGF